MGYIEPLTAEERAELAEGQDKQGVPIVNEFENKCIGTNIPPEYYTSCEKGVNDAMTHGALVGAQVEGVRVVLQDGEKGESIHFTTQHVG
jgi:elongation factor G